jgi:hypothetical protein
MTVEELLEHADRLEADLVHKRREINESTRTIYSKTTLSRQIAALQDRVDEIRRECVQLTLTSTHPFEAAA